jgi:hypothetical protein
MSERRCRVGGWWVVESKGGVGEGGEVGAGTRRGEDAVAGQAVSVT